MTPESEAACLCRLLDALEKIREEAEDGLESYRPGRLEEIKCLRRALSMIVRLADGARPGHERATLSQSRIKGKDPA